MTVWLIPLVIMAIIGSIFWLKPSKRDQRLATLRFDAIKAGLQVRQFTFKPQSEKNGVRDDVTATSYTLQAPGKNKAGELQYRIVSQPAWDNDGLPEGLWWDTQPNAAARQQLLTLLHEHWPQLQDDLLMLEADERRVTLMVSERPSASAANYQAFLQAFLPQ
ncbi:hypothetical protein CHH28_18130 [Bacterioplanes sanyensis]|uniref:Uncharacterized protein n=1 Tax=Bacterioplanes sanyensis TaxID=1249553 RepID=A0A222FPM2_9GAMM|nr:hypothetical protein [Bacterioplanes sanyensis]ASP40476.1 hypothetical protein CHH28_18130 [Bacterioplanes sanyensis]